jgi:hypothetical protein
MSFSLAHFSLGFESPLAIPTSRAYRPPCWPPPKDWVCVEDSEGNAVSRYGDPVWYLWPWTGKPDSFNFGDGRRITSRSPVIDPANSEILRQCFVSRGWGPRAARQPTTLITFGKRLRRLIELCSKNKILASNLSRYPALIDRVAERIAPSCFEDTVADLDRLRDVREILGFELLDEWAIRRLKAAQPDHEREQTEYIPPRIWIYVVNRLRECIDDYLKHQQKIEECFAFCVAAYEKNCVLKHRSRTGKPSKNTPFQIVPSNRNGKRTGCVFLGPFVDTAQRFGIRDVIERWIGAPELKRGVQGFSKYFSLIRLAGLTDVAAFTLMRIEEVTSIRKNCLIWHDDPVYGRIPLIQAETTKTDPDDHALWITTPSLEPAIGALTSIARMRLSCAGQWSDGGNPFLITNALEPWGGYGLSEHELKISVSSFCGYIRKFPLLFDLQQLTMNEHDFKIAKAVAPTLNSDWFQVGKPWPLAWHQFRRTAAVNMFASGDISDSSIQLQMKHLTRLMPLYYGRGNTALHLNEKARVLLVNAQYEAMGRQLAELHNDRYVSPYGSDQKAKLLATNPGEPVNLISEGNARTYEQAARKQEISFRLTVLGGCMKNGQCDGDCVSSVGACAGGNGHSPCSHVLFDRNRADANQIRLNGVLKQLEGTPPDTPLYRQLEQERRGLENYFAYIKRV